MGIERNRQKKLKNNDPWLCGLSAAMSYLSRLNPRGVLYVGTDLTHLDPSQAEESTRTT